MSQSDYAVIEVNGVQFDKWTSYHIASDILTPADGFQLEVPILGDAANRNAARDIFAPGAPVQVYVVRNDIKTLQMTGIVDERKIHANRSGTTMSVTGRDLARFLVDSDADPRLGASFGGGGGGSARYYSEEFRAALKKAGSPRKFTTDGHAIGVASKANPSGGLNFADMVRNLVSPWNIEVVTDASASRDILTGRSRLLSGGKLAADAARNVGMPVDSFRRSMVSGIAVSSATFSLATMTPEARKRFANSLTGLDIAAIKIVDAKPAVGEKLWEFIDRHAKRFGLMLWFSPDGKLVISSPNYGSPPLYRFVRRLRENKDDPNNILDGSVADKMGDRHSTVTVFGKAKGSSPERSAFVSTAVDPDVPWFCPKYIHDGAIKSTEEASRRALREVAHLRAKAFEYECTVADHGQGDFLYSIDTMAEVIDESVGVSGSYYLIARTFEKAKRGSDATQTQIKLVPIGAVDLVSADLALGSGKRSNK
jgi:prophage tail gpP-like protein